MTYQIQRVATGHTDANFTSALIRMPFTGFVSVYVHGQFYSGGGETATLSVKTQLTAGSATNVTRYSKLIAGSATNISRFLEDDTALTAAGREFMCLIPEGMWFIVDLAATTTGTNNMHIDVVMRKYEGPVTHVIVDWQSEKWKNWIDEVGTYLTANPVEEFSIPEWSYFVDVYWEGAIGVHSGGNVRLQNQIADGSGTWVDVVTLSTTLLAPQYLRVPQFGPRFRVIAGDHIDGDVGRLVVLACHDTEILNHGPI